MAEAQKQAFYVMGGAFTGAPKCRNLAAWDFPEATIGDYHPEGEEGKEPPGGVGDQRGVLCV